MTAISFLARRALNGKIPAAGLRPLRFLLALLAAGLTPVLAAEESPEPVRNIVFILADDLGVMDLRCYGSKYYETPNLDRLAAEGTRFTQAYAAHPVCSPTRASILTGRYPARIHLSAYIPGNNPPTAKLLGPQDWIRYLRHSETTYAEALADAGFATFHVGKWHVDSEYAGGENPGQHGFGTVQPGRNVWKKNYQDPQAIGEYTDAFLQFIEKNKKDRFLAVLSLDQVHVPLYEQPEWIARFQDKPPGPNGQDNPVMAAMVARMDAAVGRVLDELATLGLAENTAVVFFSDNGGLDAVQDEKTNKRVTATSNLPYRGGKSQCYEGGIRVPLIIRWPGVTRPGSVCDVPVISNDLYPTFLAMAGLPLRPEQHLDGLSLAPLLAGGDNLPRDTLYWHYPHYQTLPPHSAIRHGDWKLVKHYEDGGAELFDLAQDPGEKSDLAAQHPEKVRQMEEWLAAHLKAIGAQMPAPNPDHKPGKNWMSDRGKGTYDPYENDEAKDPRNYVTDPDIDALMLINPQAAATESTP
jgi:arylsulfatase A-like enzyme